MSGSRAIELSEAFDGVRVQAGLHADVTAGATQPRLVVSGDANLIEKYFRYALEEDPGSVPATVLRVWIEVPGGDFGTCIPPAVALDARQLSFIGAEGDSHVEVSGLAVQTLAIQAKERSDVTVAGTGGGRLQVIADRAFVHAASYPVSEGAVVNLASASLAEVHANGPVTGSVAADCTLTNNGAGACAPDLGAPGAKITCPVQ